MKKILLSSWLISQQNRVDAYSLVLTIFDLVNIFNSYNRSNRLLLFYDYCIYSATCTLVLHFREDLWSNIFVLAIVEPGTNKVFSLSSKI